jgi:hypothetical protein
MNVERVKVLEMLSQGKISVEQAEKLLAAIGGADAVAAKDIVKKAPKYIKIEVKSKKGDNVNVRIPMQLIKAGMKFQALIPESARQQVNNALAAKGVNVDIGKLKPEDLDELVGALSELEINVNSEGGDVVRVFCE